MSWESFCNWFIELFKSIGSWFVTADEEGLNPGTRLILAICILIIGRILIKLLMKLLRKIFGVKNKIGVDISVKTFTLSVTNVALNLLLAIGVLAILKIDFNSISSILSAGTVAIGLSLQDLISAFASGVVLLRSKWFKTGDYIEIVHGDGKCEGTVSSVGILATTLETVNNQHIVIPNNKIQQGVVTNYSTNATRRLVLPFTIDYSSDVKLVKEIINEEVVKDKRILNEPAPSIVVSNVDGNSVEITVRCFIRNRDFWDVNFQLRENVLLALKAKDIKVPYTRLRIDDEEKGFRRY